MCWQKKWGAILDRDIVGANGAEDGRERARGQTEVLVQFLVQVEVQNQVFLKPHAREARLLPYLVSHLTPNSRRLVLSRQGRWVHPL